MDEIFVSISRMEEVVVGLIRSEDRTLYQALASRNYNFVVVGVMALWDLFIEEDWIVKEHLEERIEQGLVFNRIGGEFLDASELDDQYEASDESVDDVRFKARYVYRLLRSKGWFEEYPARVNGKLETTLEVGAEAAALAEFISSRYSFRQRDKASCVFAAKATIEKAEDSYRRLKDEGRLDDPAFAKKVGKEFIAAINTCRERGDRLTIRLRTTWHAFRKKAREVLQAADTDELARIVRSDYENEIFGEVLRPLREEDGFERFSSDIVLALQTWAVDDGIRSVIELAVDGDIRAYRDIRDDLIEAKECYSRRARAGLEAIGELDREFIQAVAARYRNLVGGMSSQAGRLEAALSLMSARNGRAAVLAFEAFGEVVNMDGDDAFTASDISMPKKVTRTVAKKGVKIDLAARRGKIRRSALTTSRSRAVAKMVSELTAIDDCVYDVEARPPHSREERVWLMSCIQSTYSGAPFVIVRSEEGTMETEEVCIPAVYFAKKG